MKICPSCDRTYYDDELNFCLMDGTALSEGESQPTVVIPQTGEVTQVMSSGRPTGEGTEVISSARPTVVEQKKRGIGFWIAIVIGGIIGSMGLVAGGFFVYFLFNPQEEKPVNQSRSNRPVVTAKTPSRSEPTPLISPTLNEPEPTPPEEFSVKTITWTTTAMSYRSEAFARETFSCPPEGKEATVFGSDIYASDSSICTAAVHAGRITFEKGGKVTIIFTPGLSSYITSSRNGITTNMFGNEESAFAFD